MSWKKQKHASPWTRLKTAHGKVKSGADFPKYIQELKQLGVKSYDTSVKSSSTSYFGANDYHIKSAPKYDDLIIADACD